MGVYLRNIETGEIQTVEEQSPEFFSLCQERTEGGRPLYEQTGAHDADPESAATAEEVELRERHDVPIEDVTSDGVGQSEASREKLESEAEEEEEAEEPRKRQPKPKPEPEKPAA